MKARERLASRREVAGREWSELAGAIRKETGFSTETAAWVAGLAGLAIGLELARRWLPRPIEPQEPEDSQDSLG